MEIQLCKYLLKLQVLTHNCKTNSLCKKDSLISNNTIMGLWGKIIYLSENHFNINMAAVVFLN